MMLAQPLSGKIALRGAPLTSRPQQRQSQAAPMRMAPVAAQRSSAEEPQGPPKVVLQLFGAAAAASLAFMPVAGPALAEPPIQSAKKAAQAGVESLPQGAFDYKTREERNSKNAKGLVEKFATIKDRIDANTALANNAYGEQNIFFPNRNTTGEKVNLFKPPTDTPVSFMPSSSAVAAPRLMFAAISAPDLGSRLPKDDPTAPSGTKGQPNLPVSPGQAADAVKGAVDKATSSTGLGGALEGLKNKINDKAITDESPAKNLADGLNKPASWSLGPLRVTTVADLGGAGGASRDTESNYGGENSGSGTSSNPKQGGDLREAPNKFASEFTTFDDKPTKDTAAFAGGNPVGGAVKNIRDSAQQVPNFLGGGGVIRDDNVSAEQAAKDNIATAKASSGNAIDTAKSALGLK